MFGLFGPPSKSKFAKIVIDAARKAGVKDEIEFDEADFSLKIGTGRAYLGNVYEHYCRGRGDHRKLVLSNFVAIMLREKSTVTREMAFEQCVAAVREKALFSFMDLRGQVGPEPAKVAFEPISEWFVKTVVLDSPGSMAMVSTEDLERWELTFDELFEAGLERLRDSTVPKFKDMGGFFQGAWDDDYDSSRVLLPEISKSLPIDEPVFCLPNRLKLLIADAANIDGVKAMLQKAEWICQNEPRPSNPAPLTLSNGRVADFTVEENSPLFIPVQRAQKLSALMYYQEQKELLEQIHKQTGKDIFVAKYQLNELKDGTYRSYSVCTKTVPTLLPRTDILVFVDPNRPEQERLLASVKWEEVQRVCGDLMLDAEMFPPRYYVSKFPTEEQLREMPRHGL